MWHAVGCRIRDANAEDTCSKGTMHQMTHCTRMTIIFGSISLSMLPVTESLTMHPAPNYSILHPVCVCMCACVCVCVCAHMCVTCVCVHAHMCVTCVCV